MITLFIIDRDHLQRIFCTNKIGVKLSIYDMYNNVRLCTTMYNTISYYTQIEKYKIIKIQYILFSISEKEREGVCFDYKSFMLEMAKDQTNR